VRTPFGRPLPVPMRPDRDSGSQGAPVRRFSRAACPEHCSLPGAGRPWRRRLFTAAPPLRASLDLPKGLLFKISRLKRLIASQCRSARRE
jgi:hypothetical protein